MSDQRLGDSDPHGFGPASLNAGIELSTILEVGTTPGPRAGLVRVAPWGVVPSQPPWGERISSGPSLKRYTRQSWLDWH